VQRSKWSTPRSAVRPRTWPEPAAAASAAALTGGGSGQGSNGALIAADRFVAVGQSIPSSLKVTFGDNETKAFFGVTKGGGIGLQPLNLPQMASNVIPVSWRQSW
jgi:hypothetical protein